MINISIENYFFVFVHLKNMNSCLAKFWWKTDEVNTKVEDLKCASHTQNIESFIICFLLSY